MRTWLAALALVCGCAAAQTVELQPSDAQRCLSHTGGVGQVPDYPIAEYNALAPGRVQVRLEFTAHDRAPEVTVLMQEGHDRFVASVKDHAQGLRVPCLIAGHAPVVLHKDYVFEPGVQRVSDPAAVDPAAERRRNMLACLAHPSGWRVPEYPMRARRAEVQGRVVVKARFDSATGAPQVEVFHRSSARELARYVEGWMRDTRLPCHSGEPVTGIWTYVFVLGDGRYGFKAMSFSQFLANAKGIDEQTLQLDTHAMGCPFDVQLSYRQPLLRNAVASIGPTHPGREPLLAWMARTELNVHGYSADAIFGDSARITIPCLKIDLKPKEKTS